jgi:hypothetical protein
VFNHLDQREVEEILSRYRDLLYRVIRGAWDHYQQAYREMHHLHSPRTRASIMHDLMLHYARKFFDDMPGVRFFEQRGLTCICLEERVVLRFKKLNRGLRASNIPTRQAVAYAAQQLLLPGFPPFTRLQAGYQLSS